MEKPCPLLSIPCDDNVGCYGIDDLCDGEFKCQDGTDERAMVGAGFIALSKLF